ncbi:MAG: response regulator [Elusimicrobiota bacterium]|nr:response regulator [Elusimicrobiota bacterium]
MTKKILIAEDEWELRNLLKLILEDYDLTIFEVEDGEEAIKAASLHHPDLIMLDNNMPGLSGYEVIQQLRAITELKSIPIIMLTGKRFDEGMQQIIKMDVHEFLPKPYEEEKIVAAVKKVLGELPKRGEKAAAPTIPEIPVIPVELPAEQPQPIPVDKTVVLRPEELPGFTSVPPVTTVDKTVVLPPTELPITTPISPPTEVPETHIPTSQVISPEIPLPEETIPEVPSVEMPSVEVPSLIPPTEIPIQEITVKPPAPSPEITIPEVTVAVETKFYCVMKSSLKELIAILSSPATPSPLADQQSSPTVSFSKSEFGTVFVIAYGNETNIETLNTFIEIFSNLPVVLIDHKTFQNKLQSITSTGMEVIEINPAAFRKM